MKIIHPPMVFPDINHVAASDLSPLEGTGILVEGNSESVRLLLCRHLWSLRNAEVNIVFLKRKDVNMDVERWMRLNGTCVNVSDPDGIRFLTDAVYSMHNSLFRSGRCSLSEKEVTVLECMLLGYNQKEASELLCRSIKTLSTQKLAARMKLKAGNDIALIFNYLEITRSRSSYKILAG